VNLHYNRKGYLSALLPVQAVPVQNIDPEPGFLTEVHQAFLGPF
jgi:hypothetical protein